MTPSVGTVYLVGAGPGDPGLITVKGLDLIRRADVIIHDRLIPHELLAEARADAEIIDAGKAQHDHRIPQPQINALLVEKARAGHMIIVRLKGGDPFVFGRGGEEMAYCLAADVPCVVVPGVTSAVAVPAYAGVAVTHRDHATAFTVFSGHERPDRAENAVDYAALAAAARLGTLVMLMGVTYLREITARLLEHGIAGDTPALLIEWGTTPRQRELDATLATLADRAESAGFGSPSIAVIGMVARRDPTTHAGL
jgi:uroporphyrinogen III methyltransferase/synthase